MISDAPGNLAAPFEAGADDSIINATVLANALNSADVTVSTGDDGDQEGNITVAAPLSWTTPTTLSLQSVDLSPVETGPTNSVFIDAPITAASGGLEIIVFGDVLATATLDVGTFSLVIGDWVQNAADLPGFGATDFAVSEFASFLRAAGGSGESGDPYLIADVYGLQGIDTDGFSDASFALTQNIDASGTGAWNSGAGFNPIGEPDPEATPFGGSFYGRGNTIGGLVIDRPQSFDPVGLFGLVAGGADIRNVGLVGASIAGANQTGSLVGSLSTDSLVENVFATGSMSGADNVGGLAGQHVAPPPPPPPPPTGDPGLFTIRSAYADVSVSGSDNVGGLVGLNEGTIELAYSSGRP